MKETDQLKNLIESIIVNEESDADYDIQVDKFNVVLLAGGHPVATIDVSTWFELNKKYEKQINQARFDKFNTPIRQR